MSKNRIQTWLVVILVGAGLFVAAIFGLFAYMSLTATPLHPDAQQVRSVTQTAPSPRWDDAVKQGQQIVRADLAAQNLPGISVAVGIGGEIVWAEGFGWANIENRVPVSPDMRFRIGTASTALTSAAVGLLLEKERLKLDEKIQTYVPEFPEKQWPVTLRHVMAHLSGVKTDGGDESPLYSMRCERPVEGLRPFKDSLLGSEPGTQFRPSAYGWILMSAAVEAAADEPFFVFMREHVFEPLGMKDTRPDSATGIPNLATPYFPKFAADPRYGPDLNRQVDLSCYSGSSAFVSTPSDLVRFAMAVDSGKLLQPATVQLLQTSQRLPSGEETGYGLGWDIQTATIAGAETRVVGHDGESMGGMLASFMTFPEHGIVVSVTSNISYADTYALALKIAEAFAAQKKDSAGK